MGDVADHLAATFGLKITGIDILDFNIESAARRARRRGLSNEVNFLRMSYEDLHFPDSAFDGIYTMEALVHASNAETVLQEFYRTLRPGGHLALFEYSRAPEDKMPAHAAEVFREVNRVAAMPSFQRFEYGVLERLLRATGFTSIVVEDITAEIEPMLRCFNLLAKGPYEIARRFNRADTVINAMSAVEFWRFRDYFCYEVYTARK